MQGPCKVFAGSSHPQLAKDICAHMNMDLGAVEILKFSNENILVKVCENVREQDVFVIQTAAPPGNENIMELLIFIDALKHASAARITAVLPYFPYARSDKKDQPRISITARLMADLLETAGADRVLTMDLHSPQIHGFFRIPADQLRAVPIICDYLRGTDLENTVLVASDVGEAKEIGPFANRLNLPVAIIDKRRTGNDEKSVPTHLVGEVDKRHCIIVDDEVATGGTLLEAAGFLKKHGALSVRACATHAVLSGKAPEKINACGDLLELVVTDSIPSQNKNIRQLKVLSVAELFARAIERIHNGDSVSVLFS